MKKYKNKLTGDIVVECYNGYSIENRFYDTNIPKNIIETSSDWEEIIELSVPIGTTFKTKLTDTIYKIEKNNGIEVLVSWGQEVSTPYKVIEVNKFFETGDWYIYNEVLFKTHDGVEITDPEQYVYQVTDYHLSHDMKLHRKKASNVYKNHNVKQFYSEGSAKKYLLKNRNLLSYNNIMSLFTHYPIGENTRILNTVGVFEKKLLNLLKEKINE
jgi:hypothetical protein